MRLADMTDEELISEYKGLYEAICTVDCYAVADIVRLLSIGKELERRGYTEVDIDEESKEED